MCIINIIYMFLTPQIFSMPRQIMSCMKLLGLSSSSFLK